MRKPAGRIFQSPFMTVVISLTAWLALLSLASCLPSLKSPSLVSSKTDIPPTPGSDQPATLITVDRTSQPRAQVFFQPITTKEQAGYHEGDLLNLAVGITAFNEQTIFLFGELRNSGGSIRSVLLRSSDNGLAWIEVGKSMPSSTVLEMDFLDNGKGWALIMWTLEDPGKMTLYKTDDEGRSWTLLGEIPKSYWYGYPINMTFTDELHGQINLVYDQGLPDTNRIAFITTNDGGLNWSETGSVPFNTIPTSQVSKMDYFEQISNLIKNYSANHSQVITRNGSQWRIQNVDNGDMLSIEKRMATEEWILQSLIPDTFEYSHGELSTP